MIKIIVCDKNQNSKDIISSMLNEIENIEKVSYCNDFKEIDNFKDIDLLIFDIDLENSDYVLNQIKKIKDKNEKLKFIATSYEINSELVVKTMKQGVNDFLLKPLLKNILEATIKKVISKNDRNQNLGTISVFSSKGGVGKTITAINLAYEMSKMEDEKVCLLDLSFNQEDISTFLNIEPKFSLDYIVSNIEKSDKDLLLSLMTKYKDTNLYILSYPKLLNINSKFSPQNIVKIISALKNIFSYIVIDTKNSIDEMTLSILNASNLILFLTTTNQTAIKNSKNCYEMFDKLGYEQSKIKLILNRYVENSEINVKEIEKTLGNEVFYKLPNNYLTLIDSINSYSMVEESNPQSNIAKAYKTLAKEVLNLDFLNLNEANKKICNYNIFNLLKRMGE